jgi:very-short-patch-repair endonuclease
MRLVPTEAERKLWWHLRHRLNTSDAHFRRQVRLCGYIVDFASHQARLIVEIDGGQHTERVGADAVRTKRLETEGYRLLRFWNHDVLTNVDGVLEEIARALSATPTPSPSPQGGGE